MDTDKFHNPEFSKSLRDDLSAKPTIELVNEFSKYQSVLQENLQLAKTSNGEGVYDFEEASRKENEDSESGRTATDIKGDSFDALDAVRVINQMLISRNEAQNFNAGLELGSRNVEMAELMAQGKLPVSAEFQSNSLVGNTPTGETFVDAMTAHKENGVGSLRGFATDTISPNYLNVISVGGTGVVPRRERDSDVPLYNLVAPTQMLDFLRQVQPVNGGDTYPYIRETSTTNAAARVAENAAIPNQDFDTETISAALVKVGAISAVTNEQATDVAAANNIVETILRRNVRSHADALLMTGSGSNTVRGLNNITGLTTANKASSADVIDHYLTGIQTVYNASYSMPEAIITSYNEVDRLRKLKDTNGQYLIQDLNQGAPTGLLGMNLLVNQSTPTNSSFLVNSTDLALLTKGELRVEIGLTGTDFGNDRVSIRAITRVNLIVFRTTGIVKLGTLNT